MLSGAPPNLCFTGHMPIDGAAVCAPAATHELSCSFQKECMGDCNRTDIIGILCLPLSAYH